MSSQGADDVALDEIDTEDENEESEFEQEEEDDGIGKVEEENLNENQQEEEFFEDKLKPFPAELLKGNSQNSLDSAFKNPEEFLKDFDPLEMSSGGNSNTRKAVLDTLTEVALLDIDELVAKKQAEINAKPFMAGKEIELLMAEIGVPLPKSTLEYKSRLQEIFMDSSSRSGKREFLQKCNEFDFYSFPVETLLNFYDKADVNLQHFALGSKGLIAFSEGLKANQTIKKLNLSNNGFKPPEIKALCNALCFNSTITELDLSENNIGDKTSLDNAGDFLGEMLGNNKTLKILILKKNKLKDIHLKPICKSLIDNAALEILDLSYNELRQFSGKFIQEMLINNNSLKRLNLEWNSLFNEGVIQIVNALKTNNTLISLKLRWNGLTDTGASAIAEMLVANTQIQELNLSNNRLTQKAALVLSNSLKENMSLTDLDLSNNPFGVAGLKAIITAAEANPSLSNLNVKNCLPEVREGEPLPNQISEVFSQMAEKRKTNSPQKGSAQQIENKEVLIQKDGEIQKSLTLNSPTEQTPATPSANNNKVVVEQEPQKPETEN